jgi:diacylglycerol kinase
MIKLRQFLDSLRHALRGVAVVFRHEQSFRLQVFAAFIAIILSFYFSISNYQLLLILVMIAAVLTLEIINSIFERIIDSFKPRIHPIVRDIKDIMAGAVLIVSVVAALVGITIFWPYVQKLL